MTTYEWRRRNEDGPILTTTLRAAIAYKEGRTTGRERLTLWAEMLMLAGVSMAHGGRGWRGEAISCLERCRQHRLLMSIGA